MDNMICVWERHSVRCQILNGHRKSISHVLGSPDCSSCLSGSYDNSVRLWDLSSGACSLLKRHKWPITSLKADWQNSQALSADRKGHLTLWNLDASKVIATFKKGEHTGAVMASNLSDAFVATGCTNGLFQILDRRNGDVIMQDRIEGSINDVQFQPECECFLTANSDKKVRLYDLRNGAIRELSGHTDVVNCVRFVGKDLAVSGSGDGNILVHELTSGRLLYGLSATKNGGVNCIELTENLHALITAGDDF